MRRFSGSGGVFIIKKDTKDTVTQGEMSKKIDYLHISVSHSFPCRACSTSLSMRRCGNGPGCVAPSPEILKEKLCTTLNHDECDWVIYGNYEASRSPFYFEPSHDDENLPCARHYSELKFELHKRFLL
jgi:hypothetical protein